MMTAFVLEQHTPRQWRLLAAESVRGGGGRKFTYKPLSRSAPEALRVNQVQSALMAMAKRLATHRVELAKCYEAAMNDRELSKLLQGTRYVARQSDGCPAMVIVS